MKTRPPPWPHGVPLRRGSRQGAAHGPVDVTPARAARIGATSFSKSGLPRRSPSSRSSSSRRPRRRPRLRGPRDDGLARRLHVSEEATKEAAIEEQLRSWCRTRCARRPRGPAKVHVDHHNSVNVGRILAQCSSPQLRGYLLIHMSERWISNVAYFSEAPHSMIIDVAVVVDNHFFAQRDMLNGISHCLCTVERGTLDYGPSIMTNGSVFQKDMIIAYVALHDVRRAVSGTYCQILVLDKPPLDDIVSKYPEFGQELDEITSALGSRSSASSGRSLSVARPEGCPSGGWPSKGQPRRPPGRPWRCAPPA